MASQVCQATSEDAEEMGDAILVTPNNLACVCAGGRLLCWRGKKKKILNLLQLPIDFLALLLEVQTQFRALWI